MQDLTFLETPGFPILSFMIFLPLLTAILSAVTPNPRTARLWAVTGASLSALLSVLAVLVFRSDFSGYQMLERVAWLPGLGVDYAVGVDGISILFLPMTAFLFVALMLCFPKGGGRWVNVNLLVLLSSTLGCFAAADAMLFFVFFEVALVPGYFLIKLGGRADDPAGAARRYMIFMLLGSLPIMAGLVLAGGSAEETTGVLSFNIDHLAAAGLPQGTELVVFAFLVFGFGLKAPALPLHLWLGSSVASAPVSIMAWLLGVKLGTYGFLRFVLPLTPDASLSFAPWIIGLEVVAVVYAGLIALTRCDLRSLLVFSSIGHVGLMTAAVFSGTEDGWRGAILMMLNAGIATAALAICVGFIERRLGTSDLRAMGGLIAKAPRLTAVVFVSGLALIGVPGTSGFAGEILSLKGVFEAGWAFGLIAVTGVLLGAGYFFTAYQRGFLGPVPGRVVGIGDLRGPEALVGAGMILAVVVLGLFPSLPEGMTRASVAAEIQRQTVRVAEKNGKTPELTNAVEMERANMSEDAS
ncbi:complex I subunit 4 family protein [Anianabacter salinae]|uniref:complex I subunit 4 family protein n=1 Tax=Anianabacter salinae TaxID=2851023 RepID=UPI00225E1E7D|nr:NADH-quinone oxidoreductase subunit M [Anianabacter salinae]MBV0912760.1 NADH-quinone oxidoreductase subunit M [Anianabacter salinae]